MACLEHGWFGRWDDGDTIFVDPAQLVELGGMCMELPNDIYTVAGSASGQGGISSSSGPRQSLLLNNPDALQEVEGVAHVLACSDGREFVTIVGRRHLGLQTRFIGVRTLSRLLPSRARHSLTNLED
jgi:hypothetical protein